MLSFTILPSYSLELVEISKAEFGVLGARRKKRIFLPNVILTDSRLEREKREKVWLQT